MKLKYDFTGYFGLSRHARVFCLPVMISYEQQRSLLSDQHIVNAVCGTP